MEWARFNWEANTPGGQSRGYGQGQACLRGPPPSLRGGRNHRWPATPVTGPEKLPLNRNDPLPSPQQSPVNAHQLPPGALPGEVAGRPLAQFPPEGPPQFGVLDQGLYPVG